MPQEGKVPTEFNDKETVISHRVKDTVYIHAGFSDAESGIKSIMVTFVFYLFYSSMLLLSHFLHYFGLMFFSIIRASMMTSKQDWK